MAASVEAVVPEVGKERIYMTKSLNKFIEELKENLGDNLNSVIAFGSQANVEDAKNNLNLMIVLKHLDAENLYSISKPVQKWVKAKNPLPVIMNIDEWYSSFDVYAIEYADIRSNYRMIYGEDLAQNISVNKYFLRLQCESELKALLLKYKNAFLMNIKSDRDMKMLLSNVIKSLLVIFRSVLRLHDSEVPYRAVDIIEFVSRYLSFNKIVMTKLAKVKYENDDYTKQELIFIEAELLKDIQAILKQIDAMKF